MDDNLNSKEKFLEDFATLSGAAIGVVAVRTKEPFVILDSLREFSQEKKLAFKVWKSTTGWNTYSSTDPTAAPTTDGEFSIIPAVKKIGEAPKLPAGSGLKGEIYCMVWPHHWVNKANSMADLIQYLADYTRVFSEREVVQRLVLIVPPEYSMPTELEDSLILLDTNLPSQEELHDIWEEIAGVVVAKEKKVDYDEDDISRILAAGAGMTHQEFETTISRAFRTFRSELPNVDIDDFVRLVSETKAELVKRSEVLELMPLGSMADVGGLENLKEWVQLRKHAFDPDARAAGVDKPKGCALIGPPGTGKSLCAKAIAHELGTPLIRFDVSKVFSQFVGSSESRVREALKMLDAMAPCVAMLDEVDKAFDINSGGGDSGVGKRVLGAVLTHMQETDKDIFWVMTSNRVGGLPPELLRKGRLDEVFSVTVPSEDERMAILNIHLKKRNQNPAKIKDLQTVIERSSGFVGAEIEAAVSESVLLSFAHKTPVTAEMLCSQFDEIKPLSEAHAEAFNEMRTWSESNARAAGKGEPPATGTGKARDRGRGGSANAPVVGHRGKRNIDTDSLDG